MRFGRVSDGEGEPAPGSLRIERPFVMPGAKQPEDFAPVSAGEELINLIHTPDNRRREPGKHLTPQIPLEVDARTELGMPDLIGKDVQVELVGNQSGERQKQIPD